MSPSVSSPPPPPSSVPKVSSRLGPLVVAVPLYPRLIGAWESQDGLWSIFEDEEGEGRVSLEACCDELLSENQSGSEERKWGEVLEVLIQCVRIIAVSNLLRFVVRFSLELGRREGVNEVDAFADLFASHHATGLTFEVSQSCRLSPRLLRLPSRPLLQLVNRDPGSARSRRGSAEAL